MRNKAIATVLFGVGLWLAWADCGDAFFWKRHKAPRGVAVYNEGEDSPGHIPGAPVPEYGKVPGFVPNPYPWHSPTMFSGFRHYHVVPLIEPDPSDLAPTPPSDKAEQAPVPRKTQPGKTEPGKTEPGKTEPGKKL